MELDIFYSPVFWLVLNIIVALGILMLKRSLNNMTRTKRDELVEGPYWRLERVLGREVSKEGQREYLKLCIDTFIKLLSERGVVSIQPSLTVREIFQSLKRKEALELLELYEAVRFGQRILSDEELNSFKRILRTLARSVIY